MSTFGLHEELALARLAAVEYERDGDAAWTARQYIRARECRALAAHERAHVAKLEGEGGDDR